MLHIDNHAPLMNRLIMVVPNRLKISIIVLIYLISTIINSILMTITNLIKVLMILGHQVHFHFMSLIYVTYYRMDHFSKIYQYNIIIIQISLMLLYVMVIVIIQVRLINRLLFHLNNYVGGSRYLSIHKMVRFGIRCWQIMLLTNLVRICIGH